MIRAATKISGVTYRRFVKPALFRRPADTVHTGMLHLATRLQRHRLPLELIRASWSYQQPVLLEQTYHDLIFKNPVGLSAGFDKNFELPPLLKAIGFGFMEGGSLTYRPCPGNPRPWFQRLPASQSLVVHAGLPNAGVDAILRTILAYPRGTFDGFPLNISVAKTNSPQTVSDDEAIADYIGSLRAIQKAAVGHMITLNISCPNTYGGEPFTSPERLEKLLRAVDALNLTMPVFIKMPSDLSWPKFNALLHVADMHDIAGLTICNLAKNRAKLPIKDVLPDTIPGGLSGKPVQDISDQLIRRTYRTYGSRFTIIGVGGIFSAEDAYKKITLGASLVELITGMIFEGPQLIGEINKGLVALLRQDGYASISEAIGTKA